MRSCTTIGLLIAFLSLAPSAVIAQTQSKSSSQSTTARGAAVQECKQIHARTGKGAADNTAIRIEQCVKEKLAKK